MPEVVQFCRKPVPGAFSIERVDRTMRAALPADIRITVQENRHPSRGLLPRLSDAMRAARLAGPVNHVTGDVHYLTFFLPRRRTILTIHDTVLIEREFGARRFVLWLLWLWLPHLRSGWIVAISEATRARIRALLHKPDLPVRVIPNPVDPVFRPLPMPPVEGPFRFLHIGTKPNKNLERTMEALAGLDTELTVIGTLTPDQLGLAERLELRLRTRAALSETDLLAEYDRAHAVLFVSLAEGFGLPIVEAQTVGRPVVTSDRAPMSDVAGGAALLASPEDSGAIRAACVQVMASAALRQRLVEAGHGNALTFSPAACAAAYAALYREVAGQSEP
ncbi:MAG TPA: glycosyltransferase [Paracoccaceae bacterium]|nr:glycosyltransferase [Paracoccaceae bacterium]HMO71090.1 glycosyltransferase [Paracoccaceae bacterium]